MRVTALPQNSAVAWSGLKNCPKPEQLCCNRKAKGSPPKEREDKKQTWEVHPWKFGRRKESKCSRNITYSARAKEVYVVLELERDNVN